MIESGRSLSDFVSQMARINKGQVLYTSADSLGQYLLWIISLTKEGESGLRPNMESEHGESTPHSTGGITRTVQETGVGQPSSRKRFSISERKSSISGDSRGVSSSFRFSVRAS